MTSRALAVRSDRVPLAAKGLDAVAAYFNLLIADMGVERMALVGQLDRAIPSLGGADLPRYGLATGARLAVGQRRRPGPGAGAIASRRDALVVVEGVEGVAREVVEDQPNLFSFGAEDDSPSALFRVGQRFAVGSNHPPLASKRVDAVAIGFCGCRVADVV